MCILKKQYSCQTKKKILDFYLVLLIEAYIMSFTMNFEGKLTVIHSVTRKKLSPWCGKIAALV